MIALDSFFCQVVYTIYTVERITHRSFFIIAHAVEFKLVRVFRVFFVHCHHLNLVLLLLFLAIIRFLEILFWRNTIEADSVEGEGKDKFDNIEWGPKRVFEESCFEDFPNSEGKKFIIELLLEIDCLFVVS